MHVIWVTGAFASGKTAFTNFLIDASHRRELLEVAVLSTSRALRDSMGQESLNTTLRKEGSAPASLDRVVNGHIRKTYENLLDIEAKTQGRRLLLIVDGAPRTVSQVGMIAELTHMYDLVANTHVVFRQASDDERRRRVLNRNKPEDEARSVFDAYGSLYFIALRGKCHQMDLKSRVIPEYRTIAELKASAIFTLQDVMQ